MNQRQRHSARPARSTAPSDTNAGKPLSSQMAQMSLINDQQIQSGEEINKFDRQLSEPHNSNANAGTSTSPSPYVYYAPVYYPSPGLPEHYTTGQVPSNESSSGTSSGSILAADGQPGWYPTAVPLFYLPSGLITPGLPAHHHAQLYANAAASVNGQPVQHHHHPYYNPQQAVAELQQFHQSAKPFTLMPLSKVQPKITEISPAEITLSGNSNSHDDSSNNPDTAQKDDNEAASESGGELKEKIAEAIVCRRNVYIRGLPPNTTDESLHELCSKFGQVESSKAILEQLPTKAKDGRTTLIVNGLCKGYGFVMFDKQDDADMAVENLNRLGFEASFAKESFSNKLKTLQNQDNTNVYISNLPLTVDEKGLEQLCAKYNVKVLSSRILRNGPDGKSRGVGFARVADHETATILIEALNGLAIAGSMLPLQVRFADNVAQKKLKTSSSRRRLQRYMRETDEVPVILAIPPSFPRSS